MCYLCKYKDFHYKKHKGNPLVQSFIQYAHTRKVPVKELYKARDQWLEQESPNIKSNSRSFKKSKITELIDHVCKQERVQTYDTVPVYHMNRDGEYQLVHKEE